MEMLDYLGERLIRGGAVAPEEAVAPSAHRTASFDAHVDDLLFCASAAGLLATPLVSAASSYF